MNFITLTLFMVFVSSECVLGYRTKVPDEERVAFHWQKDGQQILRSALELKKIETNAKNIIMFLGDGMGISTVTSTRIYKGQKNKKDGVKELLTFDQFPFVSLSKTYGVDRITSDSANTGTAYLCGVKANYGTIGVDGRVEFENCTTFDESKKVKSLLNWAQDSGKSTGVVTTTRVTHATPASAYAHSPSRNWESSSPSDRCEDIAYQLVHRPPGRNIKVVMGGGLAHFVPKTENDAFGSAGLRNDSRNLLTDWLEDKKTRQANGKIIFNAADLKQLDVSQLDFLLGLFHSDHIPYVADRPQLKEEYPSLEEMTETAIKILQKNEEGFFLLVEGGSIDLAHHFNWAMKALEEGVAFDKAIQKAIDMTNEEDTLIVVTADHSHTFTIGGDYPYRGTNILGVGGISDVDNKTFTTLGYYNGPGYKPNARDRNLTDDEAENKDFRQDTALPLTYETHGAEDVPVYARGPMAHLFHGVHEQSYIPYVMGYAACVGPNQDLCNEGVSQISSNTWISAARILFIGVTTYALSVHSLF